jgi:aspartate/methionine/tyrosine aminotransferase
MKSVAFALKQGFEPAWGVLFLSRVTDHDRMGHSTFAYPAFLAGRNPLAQPVCAGRHTSRFVRLPSMRIEPFRIEHYFAKHEFSAKYLLASSDAESRTIRNVLDLEPGSHEKFLQQWCGYTEVPGAPELRKVITGIYTRITPDHVLVLSCAEEGILVLYHALVNADDHVIVETPCYESGLQLARSTGAKVSEWRRHPEENWVHDLGALEKLLQPNTKVIYINTPHNPTGLLMPRKIFEALLRLAAEREIIVFCDEVYREMEHDPAGRLPAACDLYEYAVSMGSMSKTYGLAGLRLGWFACRDAKILQRCTDFKLYTTISSSAPSEFLTAVALRHREALLKRNLEIVRKNLVLLDAFFKKRADLFDWVRPDAATIGFARFKPARNVQKFSVREFCDDVVTKSGVMLLPGSVYDEPQHIRFGYGRKNMPEALERFDAYLERDV